MKLEECLLLPLLQEGPMKLQGVLNGQVVVAAVGGRAEEAFNTKHHHNE